MNEEIKALLKKLAGETCWSDDEDFVVNDYSSGNEDAAYYGGCDDGKIKLAREILEMMGESCT